MTKEELEKYFDSIEFDFMPIGEKIGKLANLLKEAKAGKYSAEEIGLIKKLNEIEKYKDLVETFGKWNLKINKEKIAAIPFPEGLEMTKTSYGSHTFFIFTSRNLDRWYEENVTESTLPFKQSSIYDAFEIILKKQKAFGFIETVLPFVPFIKAPEMREEYAEQVSTIQELVFYKRLLYGRGWKVSEKPKAEDAINVPLPKTHLLMLYKFLKEVEQKGKKIVYFYIEETAKIASKSSLKIYKEIAAMIPPNREIKRGAILIRK